MCGIVGYIGAGDGVPFCLEGLRRLEYRGYDSSGLAAVHRGGLKVHKRSGKLSALAASLPKRFRGSPVIGHTRWATHGEPSDENAHPHVDGDGRLAVVHNGIIENAAQLRQRLQDSGVRFRSETDSEVLAHLIAAHLAQTDTLGQAVCAALRQIIGAYGVAVVSAAHPDRIVVARHGSPVVLGIGREAMFVASDAAALARHVDKVVYLDDGEVATLTAGAFVATNLEREPRHKTATAVQWGDDAYERGDHAHFMHKEIWEQPEAIARTLRGRLDERFDTAHLGGIALSAREVLSIRRIKVLACGSGYYAGMAGAHLLEGLTRIPSDAEPASEFRYRNPVVEPDALYIAVSQSGETFDTLAAIQEVKRRGGRVLGIVNVVGSTIARECEHGLYVHAGPEISVTSTKTFTATVVAFALLALHIGRIRDLGPRDGKRLLSGLQALPELVASVLAREAEIAALAAKYARYRSAFYIGRAAGYPVALEGAQKLKEVSYIHAEAYPAAELKHGPLALLSPETPTVALLPQDHLIDKAISSVEEIRARQSPVLGIAHEGGDTRLSDLCEDVFRVPRSEPELEPIVMGIPLQLFAYHAALCLGRDVDQPRNLAKSVTVE